MAQDIAYPPSSFVKQVVTKTVTVAAATLLELKGSSQSAYLRKSQITIYTDFTLGTASKIYLRYYVSWDNGTTYYQIPVKDLTSTKGELTNLPSILDASSPAKVVEDLPLSACNAFKITAQTDANTSTINAITAVVRDN